MPRLLPVALAAWMAASKVAALNLRPSGSASAMIRRLDSDDFSKLGETIFGAPGSSAPGEVEFGTTVELSAMGGSRVAIGAPRHDWATPTEDMKSLNEDGGGVFVYDFDGSSWNRTWFLAGIPKERIGDRFSLSEDGSRIAIRRYEPNGVEIYNISQTDTPDRTGFILGPDDGHTVSFAGDRVALSCESFERFTGRVEIFQEDNGQWNPIGAINGTAQQDRFGWITAFSSSGDRLAVSAPNHDGGKMNRGLVRVYDYDTATGDWVQAGNDIEGSGNEDRFGFSMDLSRDGSTLVVGSPNSNDNGMHLGKVSVYKQHMNGTWIPHGNEIPGLELNDRLGRSVSISDDGERIAASSYTHDRQRGHVRVLELIGNDWTPVGTVIDGDSRSDHLGFGIFGVSLSGDGLRLGSGSVHAEKDGVSTGHVRVFDAPPRFTEMPSAAPSSNPSSAPTRSPTFAPSAQPTSTPSSTPSDKPSSSPSSSPTADPSSTPSAMPSLSPSTKPSNSPSSVPSKSPSQSPSPSESPSAEPTSLPSFSPSTKSPSQSPSESSSTKPSDLPSSVPSKSPSRSPSPSETPSAEPSSSPSSVPSRSPSQSPSESPRPSNSPSSVPSKSPSQSPSPSETPSAEPSSSPSSAPSRSPSQSPSASPSAEPSNTPSAFPSKSPSAEPSSSPSSAPSTSPSQSPTLSPSKLPSALPSFQPTGTAPGNGGFPGESNRPDDTSSAVRSAFSITSLIAAAVVGAMVL